MSTEVSDDIPLSLARAAHSGTSFVPDRRAQSEVEEHRRILADDYADLAKLADTDEKKDLLDSEFARYRAGLRGRKIALLSASSRIMSSMIAGPANFPVRQMEKRNATAHKRRVEYLEFRTRALTAIRKKLCPELRPIMSGDADATTRLKAEIAEAEALQERMKRVNAAIRKHLKASDEVKLAALVATGETEVMARELLRPDCMRSIGFPDYRLKNNGANIRRMKQRLVGIERNQSLPDTSAEGDGVKLEDSPADNRVRLFFSGKPDSTVRDRLKSSGFRWAPSNGCWQAYRNSRSLAVAKSFVEPAVV